MIRPLTTLCLLAACGSGLYLYAEKHHAEMLDRDIAHVMRQTQAARERTGLLRAEWALLNEPGRLQDLAGRYLHLQPMAPTQFVRLADLATRLPPPEAPKPDTSADEDAAQPDDATGETIAAADLVAAHTPTASLAAPRPLLIAERVRPPHPAVRIARVEPAPVRSLVRAAPLPLAATAPIRTHLIQTRTAAAAAPLAAVPTIHSMIGSVGSVPPPVPLGDQ